MSRLVGQTKIRLEINIYGFQEPDIGGNIRTIKKFSEMNLDAYRQSKPKSMLMNKQ
jgi:hypothetical protein